MTRILSLVGYYGLVLLFGTDSCVLFDVIRWLKPFPWSMHIRLCTLLLHITYHVNITCITPCIFTCNYLWCLNACQWRCGLQTFLRTWVARVSMLFNHLIDGYHHSLFICITFITHYYHNITQLDVKCLHLTRFITLPNCGPPPSLNHNNTLSDMPTYHLLSLLSAWNYFLWYAS